MPVKEGMRGRQGVGGGREQPIVQVTGRGAGGEAGEGEGGHGRRQMGMQVVMWAG